MVEILNVPDDIPKDLLDKAECVIVLPSMLKFAIGFGGSYGRGVMTCRSGKEFSGPWSAPSMMALEGGSFGLGTTKSARHALTSDGFDMHCPILLTRS